MSARTDAVRLIALALPGAMESPHFESAAFRVGSRIFATLPPGGRHLHVFVDEEERQRALTLHPHSVEALYWGQRVLGLRVALQAATPSQLRRMLACAWAGKAPKRLLARHPELVSAHVP